MYYKICSTELANEHAFFFFCFFLTPLFGHYFKNHISHGKPRSEATNTKMSSFHPSNHNLYRYTWQTCWGREKNVTITYTFLHSCTIRHLDPPIRRYGDTAIWRSIRSLLRYAFWCPIQYDTIRPMSHSRKREKNKVNKFNKKKNRYRGA